MDVNDESIIDKIVSKSIIHFTDRLTLIKQIFYRNSQKFKKKSRSNNMLLPQYAISIKKYPFCKIENVKYLKKYLEIDI